VIRIVTRIDRSTDPEDGLIRSERTARLPSPTSTAAALRKLGGTRCGHVTVAGTSGTNIDAASRSGGPNWLPAVIQRRTLAEMHFTLINFTRPLPSAYNGVARTPRLHARHETLRGDEWTQTTEIPDG
jgi:hypothetical protein